MKYLLLTFIILGVAGCGSAPITKDEASRAKFAAKPTDEEAIRKIRAYLEDGPIDPDSLKLSCSKLSEQAWVKQSIGHSPHFGYLVVCDVNAKNRAVGSAGAEKRIFLFNGSQFQVFDYEDGPDRGRHYDLM